MAYKNHKKQQAHVKELHKMGLGKQRKPKVIKKNAHLFDPEPSPSVNVLLPKNHRNTSFLDKIMRFVGF